MPSDEELAHLEALVERAEQPRGTLPVSRLKELVQAIERDRARLLERLGWGEWKRRVDKALVGHFLELGDYESAERAADGARSANAVLA